MDDALLFDTDRTTLRNCVLCAGMTDDEIERIVTSADITSLDQSAYIFRQGDTAKSLYLILTGSAQTTRAAPDGSTTLIANFHKGDSLAEAVAFLEKPYPASAQAMAPLRVMSINGATLKDIIQKNPTVLAHCIAAATQKLHALVDEARNP